MLSIIWSEYFAVNVVFYRAFLHSYSDIKLLTLTMTQEY